jgi:3-oxoadipate enol-lactonase
VIGLPTIQVNGIQMYYELHGSGPRLLYIGGSGSDLRWKPNVFDSPLADHFTILAYDHRGLGQTEKPDTVYTMNEYADDAAALLNSQGWTSCHVIGVSFGGMVAQELAIRHGHYVKKLVLACTSSGGRGSTSYPLHTLLSLSIEDRAKKVISLTDARRNTQWQEEHPEQYDALVHSIINRFKFGEDEPGHSLGYRRQVEARSLHDTYDR